MFRYIISIDKEINDKNIKRKKSQGGDILRVLIKNNLEGKCLTIYMNEEEHLPYWQLVNKKGNVVMVPQNGPRSSPIHHQRILYLYHMNYYAILKGDLQVLHKIQPEDFQIALDKSSVLKFLLIKTKTYFTISFVFCTDTEMLSIKKIYDKSTSEQNILLL